MEPVLRKRRKQLYYPISKILDEVDQLMQSATLGLNQNYHGLLKLQDGTPIAILMYHNGLFKVLAEMNQILHFINYCLKVSFLKIMLIMPIFAI